MIDYNELEQEFYSFMRMNGPKDDKSKSNYISWLRYINNNCGDINIRLSSNLTEGDKNSIITFLSDTRNNRTLYSKENDISNFKSALNKFEQFLQSETLKSKIEPKLDVISNPFQEITDSQLSETDKIQLILARLGQGDFRNKILAKFNSSCIFSKCTTSEILIASHIKPWKDSNNKERLSEDNGILCLPTFDKLFDNGFISFDENGNLILSKMLKQKDIDCLNININFRYVFNEKQKKFMEYHRNNVFMMPKY